ncbi:hypothetical protein [Lichenicoccus sp.]|uniref:hypothetical protein n=1 Tax=Lichenicoccus sp. TaxID=2781899 RepID=UPI003D09B54E
MSDTPESLILAQLRAIRVTLAEHSTTLARLDRRVLAIAFNITRIRRENATDAETAMATLLEHDERLSRLEQATREQP